MKTKRQIINEMNRLYKEREKYDSYEIGVKLQALDWVLEEREEK